MPKPAQVASTNAGIVPVEGPAQRDEITPAVRVPGRANDSDGKVSEAASQPYGPNNEQLPERLQDALRRLLLQFSTESELSRRQEIRRIKQAHQFWRGLQYLWWDERDQNWHLPFEQMHFSEKVNIMFN